MARAWHLTSRPVGRPTAADFALRDLPLSDPGEGQISVRNRWLSVDPYMRGRMNDARSYAAPFALDEPMTGHALGEVTASRAPGFAPGDLVSHMAGWRDAAVIDAAHAQRVPDDLGIDPRAFLGLLGMPGMTAYFGLLSVASARPGDTVFVSAAAGAVGSTVVQIAKARGLTVIGSAGGAEKCAWVRALGADAVIDYKAVASLSPALGEAAPDGIDIYFDNVGGDHLDAALAHARDRARFAICGLIEIYNDAAPMALRHLPRVIGARIRLQGFLVGDFAGEVDRFHADMAGWLRDGALQLRDTVHDGLQAMPAAFLGLFDGRNIGKMLVRV